MKTLIRLAVMLAFTIGAAPTQHPRGALIEARNLAYDANYRNDQAGLRFAAASLEALTKDAAVAPYAHYYASFTYWSLAGSQFTAKDTAGALESGRRAADHARLALAARPDDAEMHAAVSNALIVVMILDKPNFEPLYAELKTFRASALKLAPANPRVVMLDASIMFNDPSEKDGPARGLARWEEAVRLFDREAAEPHVDPVVPRWGHALAYGWQAGLYLRMTPPRKAEARRAAGIALAMRPDFWWVRETVLPQLRE